MYIYNVLVIGECEENICFNGGTCEVIAGDYLCTCAMGFTGPSCNTSQCNKLIIIMFTSCYYFINSIANGTEPTDIATPSVTTISVLEIVLIGLGILVLCAIIFILTAVLCAYQMKKKLAKNERKDQYEYDRRHCELVQYNQGTSVVADDKDKNNKIEMEWMS